MASALGDVTGQMMREEETLDADTEGGGSAQAGVEVEAEAKVEVEVETEAEVEVEVGWACVSIEPFAVESLFDGGGSAREESSVFKEVSDL